jgi:hypothetical protein
MAMLSFCGIDVSKDRLDVMVLPEQQSAGERIPRGITGVSDTPVFFRR